MTITRRNRPYLRAILVTALATTLGCSGAADEDVGTDDQALVTLEYDETSRLVGDAPALSPYLQTTYGAAGYKAYGDVFYLTDDASDGFSVGVHWRVKDREGHVVRHGICRSTWGYDTTSTCDKNLPEGYALEMRLGRCDGTYYDCRTLAVWRDWSAWKAGGT